MNPAATVNRPIKPAGRPQRKACIVVEHQEAGLLRHRQAWDDLACHAAEPNSFYEPWFFLPALKAFGADLPLQFVFVYFPAADGSDHLTLAGFFPLQIRRLHRLLPVRVLQMWHHHYAFLGTPLLRLGQARQTLEAFLEWATRAPEGGALWHLDLVAAGGELTRALAAIHYQHPRPAFVLQSSVRALFQPTDTFDNYLRRAMSRRHLKELRRKQMRLQQLGKVEHRVLAPGECLSTWIEWFLVLEASGWKGRQGSAMLCSARDADFFRAILQGASARGKLEMHGLFLDEQPISMGCYFRSGPGGFAFKIAYDERFAAYSPGLQLKVAFLQHRLEGSAGGGWVDSCATPDHPLLDQIWLERRLIQSSYLSTGRTLGDLLVSLMPLARWLKNCCLPKKSPSAAPEILP